MTGVALADRLMAFGFREMFWGNDRLERALAWASGAAR
jgi:hypothetical protein